MSNWKPIIGKKFTTDGFDAYVKSLGEAPSWVQFCVLHNTSSPTLAERPNGLTMEHIQNLESYYQGLGWSAGPHLFVDQGGIWVFTPLTETGVHSPSWNHESWGIEQLGEYETESWQSGPGAQVAHNAICALATLCAWRGLDSASIRFHSASIRFHKEDPQTTHKDCPGKNCLKPDVLARAHNMIALREKQAARAPTEAPTTAEASTFMPDAAPFAEPGGTS